jgi:uncharacterized protein (DUF2147 family)
MWKVFALVLITMALASAAGASERRVEGLWLTQGKSGVVEIYRCSESVLCGRLVWFRVEPSDPDPPQVDIHNPTPGLRTRPLCGLTIMWGLQPDGPDRWTDGSLYDPESGNTYNGYIRLNPDGTLTLRGYIAISLFGRSETWTRYTRTIERCPSE